VFRFPELLVSETIVWWPRESGAQTGKGVIIEQETAAAPVGVKEAKS